MIIGAEKSFAKKDWGDGLVLVFKVFIFRSFRTIIDKQAVAVTLSKGG